MLACCDIVLQRSERKICRQGWPRLSLKTHEIMSALSPFLIRVTPPLRQFPILADLKRPDDFIASFDPDATSSSE